MQYDKDKIKEELTLKQIYELLEEWGGSPEYTSRGIVAQTICHNLPGEGSRKLYYYDNDGHGVFFCYTHCEAMDVYEVCLKVMKLQHNLDWTLYEAIDYIVNFFNFSAQIYTANENEKLPDWDIFKKHNFAAKATEKKIQLPEFNVSILDNFIYPRITSWEKEGISNEVIQKNRIGYYPSKAQITIPHFDIDNRLVGIRGRTLVEEDAKYFGKYRPLKINQQLYNHPLSMNLYNINNSSANIKKAQTAIVFESEKATLMFQSYYGAENDISVACCGSSLSAHQVLLLRRLGVREIILGFDRDFEEVGDEKFQMIKKKLIHLKERYGAYVKLTTIFDKNMLLPLHSSPIDQGPKIFEKLLTERFVPQ